MFKNLMVKKKIIIGFGTVILLMIVVGFVGFQALLTTSDGFKEYRSLARETNLTGRIQANMLMVRMNVKDFQITGSEQDKLQYEEYVEKLTGFINEGYDEITDPERQETITIIDESIKEYQVNFEKIIDFREKRDNYVYQVLDIQGPFMENTLTDILVSAEDDNDTKAAYNTALALKHLLLARLYMAKFLDTNDRSAVNRVQEEYLKMQEQLDILEEELQNSQRIKMRLEVQNSKGVYLNTFSMLTQIIDDRNNIQRTILDRIGPEVAASIENMKLSVKDQQDMMGPKLQASNTRALVIISIIGLAALLTGILLAIFIMQSITKPLAKITESAIALSKGEVELSIDIDTKDELGILANSFREIIKSQKAKALAAERIAEGDFEVDVSVLSDQDLLGKSMTMMKGGLIDRENELIKRAHTIGERVKELNCLNEISKLVEQKNITLENILQGVVELIPPSWQYPDITCAKLTLMNKEYKTDNFKETKWKQSANIEVSGEKTGFLEVIYIEEMPEIDEGPFAKEERDLINVIVERVGQVIEVDRAEKKLKEHQENLEELIEKRTGELKESEKSLTKAQKIAKVGHWKMDPKTKEVSGSDEVFRIFGLNKKEIPLESFVEVVHPDDREMDVNAIQRGIEHGENWDIEHRLILKDGTEKTVHAKGEAITDETGKTVQLLGTVHDITELKEKEKEIIRLNTDLEQRLFELDTANKELEGFSYSVSHDLRAPLRAIDGFSQILIEDHGEKLDDDGERVVNVIRRNTRKMGNLIDDMLEFSRIGRKKIRKSRINMEQLAKEIFNELKASVTERNLRLNLNALPYAYGDEPMIRQIMENLISNAVKFTGAEKNAVIEIDGKEEKKENMYYVKDNGAGFDMKYVDKLFGVFQRLHSADEYEGTGIGLSLVKRIIDKHSGRVWAEGKVDEGATFYFTLPKKGE